MLYSQEEMLKCTFCELHKTRTNVVIGRGDPTATLWLIGEAPGKDEDATGQAFVGRAGRLLDMCLKKARIERFYIANTLKCRPPENRNPTSNETEACTKGWLIPQILEHRPLVLVAMGRFSIGFTRGYTWEQTTSMTVGKEVREPAFRTPGGRWVYAAYHPAYLLRNGEAVQSFIDRLRLARELHAKLRAARLRRSR
jgi:DNA polymerase